MIPPVVGRILRAWEIVRTVLVVAFAAAVASYCAGCGGAMLGQARAATVATVALEGARRVTLEVAEERSAMCEDEACVAGVAESLRPVRAAYDGLRVTLSAWVSALDVARLAGAGDDLLPVLITAGLRFLADWRLLADALAGLGVDLPQLPDGVLADLGVAP